MLLPAPGKTFWCQLGQAGRVQKPYRAGLEGWISYKMQRMPRLPDNCEATGHTDALWHERWSCTQKSGKKKKKDGNVLLQNLTDIRKEKKEGIIIKTNKQTSKQIPAWNYIISLPDPISLSLPWEPFCSHEWWLKASSWKQLSEFNARFQINFKFRSLTYWCWLLEHGHGREVGGRIGGAVFKIKKSLPTAKSTVSGGMWWWFQMVQHAEYRIGGSSMYLTLNI